MTFNGPDLLLVLVLLVLVTWAISAEYRLDHQPPPAVVPPLPARQPSRLLFSTDTMNQNLDVPGALAYLEQLTRTVPGALQHASPEVLATKLEFARAIASRRADYEVARKVADARAALPRSGRLR